MIQQVRIKVSFKVQQGWGRLETAAADGYLGASG